MASAPSASRRRRSRRRHARARPRCRASARSARPASPRSDVMRRLGQQIARAGRRHPRHRLRLRRDPDRRDAAGRPPPRLRRSARGARRNRPLRPCRFRRARRRPREAAASRSHRSRPRAISSRRLGIVERADALARANPGAGRRRSTPRSQRLTAPDQMGDLFKVFCAAAPGPRARGLPHDRRPSTQPHCARRPASATASSAARAASRPASSPRSTCPSRVGDDPDTRCRKPRAALRRSGLSRRPARDCCKQVHSDRVVVAHRAPRPGDRARSRRHGHQRPRPRSSASSPPTARRSCSPTPRPASSAPPTPAGRAPSTASSTRPSSPWSASAPTPHSIVAAIGPTISAANYEVGPEFAADLLAKHPARRATASARPTAAASTSTCPASSPTSCAAPASAWSTTSASAPTPTQTATSPTAARPTRHHDRPPDRAHRTVAKRFEFISQMPHCARRPSRAITVRPRREAHRVAGMATMKLVTGNSNRALAEAVASLPRAPPHRLHGQALRRQRDLRRDPRERPRRGRLHPAVDVVPGQRQPDGAADPHRRAPPLLGPPHHRGDPLFRLRPAGPPHRPAARRSRPSSSPTSSPRPASTASSRSISTPPRSRASSISRPTTSTPRRSSPATSSEQLQDRQR